MSTSMVSSVVLRGAGGGDGSRAGGDGDGLYARSTPGGVSQGLGLVVKR
jgi:hypothetical protein